MSWTILTSPISSITTRGSKGAEVALPREDEVYLLGTLTGQTPKKRRVTQSRSDLKDLNVACSCPVETEQHELDPDGNGADEMVTRSARMSSADAMITLVNQNKAPLPCCVFFDL